MARMLERIPNRVLAAFIIIAVMVLTGVAVWQAVDSERSDQTDRALDQRITAAEADVDDVSLALARANDRLERTGAQPVPVPQAATGPSVGEGITGLDGEPGAAGSDGQDGARGADGRTGRRGQPGADGMAGAPGTAGEDGADGQDGATGPPGPTGPIGPQGDPGPTGPTGPRGSADPGTYTCDDGQYLVGFTVGDAGGVTLDCRATPPPALLP